MINLVEANFIYKKSNGTEVNGKIYFAEKNGVLYKPMKIDILFGKMSLEYRNNDGKCKSAKKRRVEKDNMIKKYCHTNTNIFAQLTSPFQTSSKGLVGVMGLISGANQTRDGKMYLKTKLLNNYKVAKLFQNLKAINNEEIIGVIDIETFINQNENYIEKLKQDYDKNIETATRSYDG